MIPLNTHEASARPLTLTRGAEITPAVHISTAVAVAVCMHFYFLDSRFCTAPLQVTMAPVSDPRLAKVTRGLP